MIEAACNKWQETVRAKINRKKSLMVRLGLCCKFYTEAIRFYTTTARYLARLTVQEREKKLSGLCLANAESLLEAIEFCHQHSIGSFRINSRILPLKTHPDFGYDINKLESCWSNQRVV